MHEEIALANQFEHRPTLIAHLRGDRRSKWRILQRGKIEQVQPHQLTDIQQMAGGLNVLLREIPAFGNVDLAKLVEEKRTQMRRHVVLNFDAHHFAKSPLKDLLFDRREKVFRLFDWNVEIR